MRNLFLHYMYIDLVIFYLLNANYYVMRNLFLFFLSLYIDLFYVLFVAHHCVIQIVIRLVYFTLIAIKHFVDLY